MKIPRPFSHAMLGDIEVLITAIMIRGELIQVEIAYVLNGDRKSAWVELPEISNMEQVEIGFRE